MIASAVRMVRGIPRAASSGAVRHMRRWQGVTVLLITLGCWSSVPLFLKELDKHVDHWTNNGWRYGASALFWLPAVLWALGRRALPVSIWRAALVPALFNTVAQIAFTAAYHYVDAGIVTFGLRLQMVFVAVGAFLLFPVERSTIKRRGYLLGLALLMAGIVAVLWGQQGGLAGANALGVWLSVGSGVGYAAYGLSVRRFMEPYHPVYAFGVICLYTGAALVTCMFIWSANPISTVLHLPSTQLWELALSAFLGIALGHVLYYTAIDRLGVATAAAVLQLQPFIVSALALPLFGEHLSPLQWSGGIIALGGAVAVLMAQRAAERAARGAHT